MRTILTTSILAGAEGFEPPSPVLETGSLTVELTPLRRLAAVSSRLNAIVSHGQTESTPKALLRFFVRRVLATESAKLVDLETAGGRLFVLGFRVIPVLAIAAL